MSEQPLRWGIIGPGRIAYAFADALKVVEGTELYGVASRDEERGRVFAQQYHVPQAYTSYEQMAQDPLVDAVYIATPHRFHHEQTLLCLEAGKPVLCEKSLTVNARQSQELIALAQSKNLFLMEALWTRFLPIYAQVREWLDAGLIGDVKLLSASFGFRIPRDVEDRLLNPDLAGEHCSTWVFIPSPCASGCAVIRRRLVCMAIWGKRAWMSSRPRRCNMPMV